MGSASQGGAGGGGRGPAPAATRPEAIKAIPVRHWGRWISAVVMIYLVVALVYSFAKNPKTDWHVVGNYLFSRVTLRGVAAAPSS